MRFVRWLAAMSVPLLVGVAAAPAAAMPPGPTPAARDGAGRPDPGGH